MLKKVWLFLVVITTMFLISSCEDKDADEHHDDHFEPVEWIITQNDTIYMHIDRGVLSDDFKKVINLTLNDTIDFNILFKDEDGDFIESDEDEISLNWEILDSNIISIIKDSKNSSKFAFSMIPNSKGTTVFKLMIMHGDHLDIITPQIPIYIE